MLDKSKLRSITNYPYVNNNFKYNYYYNENVKKLMLNLTLWFKSKSL